MKTYRNFTNIWKFFYNSFIVCTNEKKSLIECCIFLFSYNENVVFSFIFGFSFGVSFNRFDKYNSYHVNHTLPLQKKEIK